MICLHWGIHLSGLECGDRRSAGRKALPAVDGSYCGGEELGLAGGRAKGKKVLVGIAVERAEPTGFGRCRMAPLVDGSGDSLRAFLTDNVEPGARVITDGWQPYRPATEGLYVHERVPGAAGPQASKLLPGCTRSPR